MRRHEKQITDQEEIAQILQRSQVCRLGLCDGDQPYIVPLCFGFIGDILYFHCAVEGRKLDIIRANPRVCVEFDVDQEIIPAPVPCRIGTRYRSVLAFGAAAIVEDVQEKRAGLEAIVRHYVETDGTISEDELARVIVVKVTIREMTGKRSGY